MTRARALPLVALFVLSNAARAQAPDLTARVDAATLEALQPIFEAARRDSLPVRALESKVLEGVAKGVDGARIRGVVAELAQELRRARAGLRASLPATALSDAEVVATATAARHGVGPDVVAALWEARPGRGSVEVPVTVLGELVRRGVPVDDAVPLMAHVVRSSVPLDVAMQIPGKLDVGLAAGSTPASALVGALRALGIPDPPGRRRDR